MGVKQQEELKVMVERTSRFVTRGMGLVIIALGIACTSTAVTHPRYGFEVTVAPSTDTPGAYETTVTVRDLASGQIVFQPKLLSPEGELATIEASDRASGVDFSVTVKIGAGGRIATYSVELRDAAGVVTTQDAKVQLQPS